MLQGNIDEAFRHFRVVLAGTAQYNSNVFALAWKATDDAGKILQELIPEQVTTEFSYLNFLVSQRRLDEAQAVWKRIVAGREEFPPDHSSPYIDSLIAARRAQEAYQVWTDLQKKGLIRYSSMPSEKNLISNGDFEDELLNFGFAWRIVPVEGVYAGPDTSTYHSPSHAFLIQFSGKQNLLYQHVYQYVKVSPGQSYRLRAFMKTEGITTDSGPRLEVYDAYNAAALDKLTDDLTGSYRRVDIFAFGFRCRTKNRIDRCEAYPLAQQEVRQSYLGEGLARITSSLLPRRNETSLGGILPSLFCSGSVVRLLDLSRRILQHVEVVPCKACETRERMHFHYPSID